MIIWSEEVDKNYHQLSERPSCNSSCNPINTIKTLCQSWRFISFRQNDGSKRANILRFWNGGRWHFFGLFTFGGNPLVGDLSQVLWRALNTKSQKIHRLTTIIKTGEKKDINQKNGKARKSRKCVRKICFNLESFVSMHLNDRPPCSNGSTYFKCKEILQNSNPRKLELHVRYFTTCHHSDSNTNTAYFEASKGSISNLMCLVLMLSVALNGVIQGCHQASPASNDFIYSVYYTPHCLRGRNRNENRCLAI